jgi:flagellar basal-body rod protein FlgF
MIPGLYQSAAGMLTQMDNHQVIAENIASSSVPGHRRNQVSFQALLNEARQNGPKMDTPMMRSATDFSQGPLETDGNPMHLAISGNGFFTIQLPDSRVAYTRNGTFHLSVQGEVVTPDGMKVLDAGGSPLVVQKPNEPVQVNELGQVLQKGNVIGRLQISKFEDNQKMQWMGGTYFIPGDGAVRADAGPSDYSLRQGFLETSNVNPVQEMVSLIQASRMYEANQKMMQAQDSALEQVIRQASSR